MGHFFTFAHPKEPVCLNLIIFKCCLLVIIHLQVRLFNESVLRILFCNWPDRWVFPVPQHPSVALLVYLNFSVSPWAPWPPDETPQWKHTLRCACPFYQSGLLFVQMKDDGHSHQDTELNTYGGLCLQLSEQSFMQMKAALAQFTGLLLTYHDKFSPCGLVKIVSHSTRVPQGSWWQS